MVSVPFIFGYLPQGLTSLVAPAILIVIGFLVEHNFVGRVATFTNSLAVNLAYYGKDLPTLGIWQSPLILYLNIGLIMGIISILAYSSNTRLPQIFYIISWAYSSIVVGIVVLLSLTVAYPLTIPTPIYD